MNENQKKIVKYYTNPETKLGFDYLLWGSKHFGFYPTGKANITEKQAQILLQDLVAKSLHIKKNQVILDAGCGQGVVSTYLAKKYKSKIFGITLVPFEVKKAQERAKDLSVLDKTNYEIMDYSDTDYSNNHFDAIYTTETLSHSPNIRKTLKEFFRILKPGGRVAFFEYVLAPDEDFSPWERKMLDLVIDGSAMMGLKDFRRNQFPKIMQDVGFINIKEKNITENINPSFYRLHKFSMRPYKFIKFFHLQKFFINTTAGYECYKMVDRGLINYCIFTGNKPQK
jgi:SAM-dependent methyltransferase